MSFKSAFGRLNDRKVIYLVFFLPILNEELLRDSRVVREDLKFLPNKCSAFSSEIEN